MGKIGVFGTCDVCGASGRLDDDGVIRCSACGRRLGVVDAEPQPKRPKPA